MADKIGFSIFYATSMLDWVRADHLNLDQTHRCSFSHPPPRRPTLRHWIDAVGNDPLAEDKVRFRDHVGYCIPSGAHRV